ncbi:MAG: phenylalanine--tRNA ligase subunit beta [Bacteroidales bacterium]|nr:phenylalanine--tRNA ligase subunit beta [Bacteroidales bacterium]
MKISYNWLKQYIDINSDFEINALSKLLTDCGLEVEGLERVQSVKGGLEGVIIGKVITKESHPNSDHLSITTVDIGQKEPLNIVCGASNVEAGQMVPVAVIGATLYDGDNPFKIKRSKLRGVVSEGMICAEDELGLGNSHDGIMVLDPSAIPGTPAKDYFNLEEDYIIEIGLTPNRSDAISHIGVARDLCAVLNNLENKKKTYKLLIPSVDNFSVDNNENKIDVEIENSNDCPRYSGITISGIKVEESPDWLKKRLESIDIRPVNNIVDITNFVMFETGQPLHSFDTDKIKGNKIIVKKLPKDTPFITLDNIERKLSENDLMICNPEEGMCIAGVFGGIDSGISETTKNIFIESACFDPKTVRKTSKLHSLKTDASFRFERGTDPNITIYALKRAALLIKEICGGNISSDIVDVYPKHIDNKIVNVYYKNIDRLIGKFIDRKTIKNILLSLEIKILNETDEGLKLSVPTYRVDVTREADIIEEVLRIYGYNNIEIPSNVNSTLTYSEKPDKEKINNIISDFLTNNGFYEIMNNSLTKSEYLDKINYYKSENSVKILNPLSKDLNILRQTLLFGGLESIIRNINRKIFNLKFYEFGKSYQLLPENISKENVLSKYSEVKHLSIFITGQKNTNSWKNPEEQLDFYYLKATVNNILKRLGINYKIQEISTEIFSEGLSYSYKKKTITEFGQVSKKILKIFGIKQPVFYADINWDVILENLKFQKTNYKEVSKFPEVRRDLALLIDKKIKFADIKNLAFETEKNILKSVSLFDIYEGDKIDSDKKSYAVNFILQGKNKTLTDKIIDKTMNKFIKVFETKLNARIR